MSRLWTVRLVVLLAACGALSTAHAELRRVALVEHDANLTGAVVSALKPWGIQVVVTTSNPGFVMPAASDAAGQLAVTQNAGAVAWISEVDGQHALWIYDRVAKRVVARRLIRAPPFDPPTAAAVALSVKTLLRHSLVAPENERFAADSTPPPTRWRAVLLDADVGLAMRPDNQTEPRIGLGLAWSPPVFDDRIALSAGVRFGPGVDIEADEFVGRFSDTRLSVGFRLSMKLASRVRLLPIFSFAVHLTEIDGALLSPTRGARASRTNPAISAGLRLQIELKTLRLGLQADASHLFRRQEYEVGGIPIFVLPGNAGGFRAYLQIPFSY